MAAQKFSRSRLLSRTFPESSCVKKMLRFLSLIPEEILNVRPIYLGGFQLQQALNILNILSIPNRIPNRNK